MGNCIRNTDRRWLNGIVPYRIDDVSADIVARAINAWADADVGVRFVPYTGPTDPGRAGPHIVFAPGGEAAPCTSKIGRVGVGQRINCDLRESRLDTLIHEIGHALGLQHEHQRFDRGNHVAVIEDNIVAGYRFAYDRLSIDDGLPHGPYDFDSIMHYPESQFAVDFTVNVDVPGLSTPHPPALALFGDELHIVVTDSDRNLRHSRTRDLRTFQTRVVEGQSSKAAPVLAAFDGKLFLVHLGRTSDDVWISHSSNGRSFSRNERIAGMTARTVPGLAGFGGQLHLVWKGAEDKEIRHSRSDSGRADNWTQPRKINQSTHAGVGLTATARALHLVHLGNTSKQIWQSTGDGRGWTENRTIGQTSKSAPALAGGASTLHLAHLGESSDEIWHATGASVAGANTNFTRNQRTNQLSRVSPVLAAGRMARDPVVVLGHRGQRSNRVYLSQYNPDLLSMISLVNGRTGGFGGDVPTTGDLAAVRFMYG